MGKGPWRTSAECILFGQLKTDPPRTIKGRALRHAKCFRLCESARFLRDLARAAFKPVRKKDLLKAGVIYAPVVDLSVSKIPLQPKRRRRQ